MYDRRQEANEFVGDTIAEAKAKAAEFYGTDPDELRVGTAKPGEIFGAGGRTVIVAIPRGVSRSPQRAERGSSRGDESEERGRGPRRGQDRGQDRDRGRDRGRDRDNDRDRDRDRGRGREGRSSRGRESRDEAPAPVPVAVENSKGTAKGEIGAIGEFLLGAVERMKLGSFEISESSEGNFLIYELRGDAADALRAGDGRAVDALQLIANQVAVRQDEDPPRVVVDVDGGGDQRERTLSRLVERAIKRARETGRAVALDPMGGRDRRSIHLAARDEDGIATMSIGEGRYRQVLVVPEGAPEYDDAVVESSRS